MCHIIRGFPVIGNIRPKLLDVRDQLIVEELLLGPFWRRYTLENSSIDRRKQARVGSLRSPSSDYVTLDSLDLICYFLADVLPFGPV
jgi:hypothetical protein